jgi:hypothetical protein
VPEMPEEVANVEKEGAVAEVDPTLPSPENQAARAEALPARSVPNKPGFVISPWDQKEIDASGFEPGAVIMDPNSTPGVPRFLKMPDDHIHPEDTPGESE